MITLNGKQLPTTLFPDNTSQVWKLPEHIFDADSWVHIVWDFTHEGEFMQIAQLKMLLDAKNVRSALRLKYLPYGRQDKFVGNNVTFALYTFAQLLNSLNFEEVIILDPHSKVALDIIKNSRAEYPLKELEKVLEVTGSTSACYPDHGALSKYKDLYSQQIHNFYIYGEKVRDQLTGNITNYELKGDLEFKCKDQIVLIVDDICDGGMTFKILAADLLKSGAKEVNLFVTHGLFSKGIRTLKDSGITRVFSAKGEHFEDKQGASYLPINKLEPRIFGFKTQQ